MTKKTPEPTTAADSVSASTLEATAGRALLFLRGIGTTPRIRGQLSTRGYTQQEHDRGWDLLHKASGYEPGSGAGLVTESDQEVLHAISSIDSWDEDGFRIIRAALTRLHPAQAKKVLEGLAPATGPASILGVKTVLERIDGLAHSHDPADRAAVHTLEKRGITPAERQRLAALVKIAQKGASPTPPDAALEAASNDGVEAHLQALTDLRAWYEDWADMARATIKRRDWLIRIGLAKRKQAARAPSAGHASSPAPTATT